MIRFQPAAQTVILTVTDSVIADNGGDGIIANPYLGAASIMVRNSTVIDNHVNGLAAFGQNGVLRVTKSTITGNNTAWADGSGAVVLSYGDNNIDGNGSANTEPPNALTYK